MTDPTIPIILPRPTVALVESESILFDTDPGTELGEKAMCELRESFPSNTDASHVLLKALVLDRVYSTRLNDMDMWPLARHIAKLGIDPLLDRGEPSAVRLIFKCEGLPMYYSFATKFCSWHNSGMFPIYDSYVDASLWAYNKQDKFANFKRGRLGYYEDFIGILGAFRKCYSLENIPIRDIDKFLWRTGARILGKTLPETTWVKGDNASTH